MELRRAAEARTGTWAVAQAINRQVLQRATANYDLAMGNQAPMRQQARMASPALGFSDLTGPAGAAPPAQAIVGQSGEVQAITGMRVVGSRAFAQRGGQWVDLRFDPQKQQVIKVQQFSKAVLQLVQARSDLAKFVSLGDEVIIVIDDKLAVHIGAEGKTELSDDDLKLLKASTPASASNRGSQNGGRNNLLFATISVAIGTILFAFAKRLLLC